MKLLIPITGVVYGDYFKKFLGKFVRMFSLISKISMIIILKELKNIIKKIKNVLKVNIL